KIVQPISRQLPSESHRLWESVTSKLLSKEYGEATCVKQVIEQRQRDEAGRPEVTQRRVGPLLSVFHSRVLTVGSCQGILRRISRAAYRHSRKPRGRRSKRRSSTSMRTRTRTV
ncbi:hypothetical protein EDB89DRAFT_1850601, partial [Lactarius sanguifluus]